MSLRDKVKIVVYSIWNRPNRDTARNFENLVMLLIEGDTKKIRSEILKNKNDIIAQLIELKTGLDKNKPEEGELKFFFDAKLCDAAKIAIESIVSDIGKDIVLLSNLGKHYGAKTNMTKDELLEVSRVMRDRLLEIARLLQR